MTACICDYDPPEFCTSQTRKARKSYKCDECRGTIAVGEAYEYVFGKWDGYLSTFKTCLRCLDLRTWVKNSVPCFCWAHGSLTDDMREAVAEAAWRAPEETVGLRFGLLRRIELRTRFNREAHA